MKKIFNNQRFNKSHHFNNRRPPRKFDKDGKYERPPYKKNNGEEGGPPFKKYPPKEYKDLDDPSKINEEKTKGSFLINYNDI